MAAEPPTKILARGGLAAFGALLIFGFAGQYEDSAAANVLVGLLGLLVLAEGIGLATNWRKGTDELVRNYSGPARHRELRCAVSRAPVVHPGAVDRCDDLYGLIDDLRLVERVSRLMCMRDPFAERRLMADITLRRFAKIAQYEDNEHVKRDLRFSTGIRSDSVFGSYACRRTCSMRLRRELLGCRFTRTSPRAASMTEPIV
jgi:hypothetical protein